MPVAPEATATTAVGEGVEPGALEAGVDFGMGAAVEFLTSPELSALDVAGGAVAPLLAAGRAGGAGGAGGAGWEAAGDILLPGPGALKGFMKLAQ